MSQLWFATMSRVLLQELASYLEMYRRSISNLSVSFETNIEFYTAINFALMNWSQSSVIIPQHATLWTMITALGALLRSSGKVGEDLSTRSSSELRDDCWGPPTISAHSALSARRSLRSVISRHIISTGSPTSAVQETLSHRLCGIYAPNRTRPSHLITVNETTFLFTAAWASVQVTSQIIFSQVLSQYKQIVSKSQVLKYRLKSLIQVSA